MPKADAHIHLFDPGYVKTWSESCRRVSPTEVTLYDEFTRLHDIETALVVGYAGEPWAQGNNEYIAGLAKQYAWIQPIAYIHDPRQLDVSTLEELARQGFVGISLYLFTEDAPAEDKAWREIEARLSDTSHEVWAWLTDHHWLISVNSRGECWRAWQIVLAEHPQLNVLIAHLGLPPRLESIPDSQLAQANLAPILALADAPNVHVKLSGFYALTEPGYAYPHTACRPYVEVLLDRFTSARLLWGSDFAPALEWISFPQSVHLLEAMSPSLAPATHRAITYDNLSRLLHNVVPTTGTHSKENSV